MDPKKLREQLRALVDELDGLRKLDTFTDEQDTRFNALIAEINTLGAKIVSAENGERAASAAAGHMATAERLSESRGRVSAIDPKEGARSTDQRDYKALGQRFVDSDALKKLQERQGNTGAETFSLESFHAERNIARRAIVNTPVLPGDYLVPDRIPGIQRPSDPYGTLRDVLSVGGTNSDLLEWFEETAFTNNAAIVAEATATTGSSGLKPESGFTFTQKTAGVVTVAHWVAITKQMIWNAPELQSYVEGRLIDGLKLKEDAELLNGDGTSGHMTGLLATSGVQVLDDTYFSANPTSDVGTVNELFNRILRAKTKVSSVGRAQANFVVLNPEDDEVIMSTTDGQRQYFGAGPFAGGAAGTLWGLRKVINENLAAGSALVGDGRQAMIKDRLQAQITIGWQNDQFVRNMFTLLAEERVGLTVFRPSAFANVTLPSL